MSVSFFVHDNIQFKIIKNILKNDVFEFYDFKKQYYTDLKQKLFKENVKYKEKLAELEKEKRN